MKQMIRLGFLLALMVSRLVFAQYEVLPTLTVEGKAMEQGAQALQPAPSGALDTSDFLRQIPGANVNRNGPLTGIAQFRGLYGNQVNVMIDGMGLKEAGPNSMDAPMSYLPSSLVQSVTVYRGVTPVSSGLETLGGTIQVKSRKSQFTDTQAFQPHGFAASGYSWVNSGRYGSILAALSNDRYRMHFTGSTERGKDYRFKGDSTVTPSEYTRDLYSVGLGARFGAQEVGLDYDNRHVGRTGTPSLPMDIIFFNGDIAHADYQWDFGGGYRLKVDGFYQSTRHLMDNFSLRPVPRPDGTARFRQNKVDVKAGAYKAALTIPDVGPGSLSLGADGDLSTHNGLITDPTNALFFLQNFNDAERNRYGIYAEWDGLVTPKLSLQAGVRYNRVAMNSGTVSSSSAAMMPPVRMLEERFNNSDRSRSSNNVDVALDFRYFLTENLDLAFGLARKTHAPTYQQRYLWIPLEATGGLADGRVYVGDVALDSEKAYEAVLGFDYSTSKLSFKPRAFYRYVDDCAPRRREGVLMN